MRSRHPWRITVWVQAMNKLPPKKQSSIYLMLIALGAVVAAIGAVRDITASTIAGMGIILAAMILHVVFYRCPNCGRYLDRSDGDFCPYCGKNIEESQKEKR